MSMTSKLSFKIANIFSNNDKQKQNQTTQAQTQTAELEALQEKARKETLKLTKTSRLGFPYKPTCIAYDMVQHLIAIGTRYGYVKLYGGESIEYTIYHSQPQAFSSVASSSSLTQSGNQQNQLNYPCAVLFIQFVINEGALITYCEDSTISFWNLRQKQPGITYSKKLINEKATCMYLPYQSPWLYIGTEKGNIYLLNVYNNFSQSGYDMKWNNVIELTQKTKPGKVVNLSEHPLDSSKLLIGFDSGLIVLWNLKQKRAESRFYGTSEQMSSIGWFNDGKQFISSHNNGSLIVWNSKNDSKPVNIMHPHMSENDLIPRYNMIKKVYWETNKQNESLIIFSDGLPNDCSIKDAITIIKNNKYKTIIEMKDKIVDFLLIQQTPWFLTDNPSDPLGLIVLLESNLCFIDLKSDGYPQFKHHHQVNLHESQINVIEYLVEPSKHLYQYLINSRDKLQHQQSIQQQQQQQQPQQIQQTFTTSTSTQFFSSLPYPIQGGLKCTKSNIFPYNELIVTGHEDGSVRFWDSSGLGLSLLYKFKTHKLFDKRRDTSNSSSIEIDSPFKITALTVSNNYLAVAAAGGHVTLYKYHSKNYPADEELADIPLFEIQINYEYNQESASQLQYCELSNKKELKCFLRTKIGFRKQQGYQPELVCLLFWSQKPPVINNINIYTKTNIMFFGTDESIIGVDYVNRTLLINVSLVTFYGNQDPFHRGQRSPKKNNKQESDEFSQNEYSHQSSSGSILPKQITFDTHKQDQVTISRSSSCESLENLSQSEGISFIAVNDYSQSIISNIKNEFQQQTSQLWLGTTYGSCIILNLITISNSDSNNSNAQNSNQKNSHLTPTGLIHTLKGEIMNISFLDFNGNLLSQGTNTSNSSSNYSSHLQNSQNLASSAINEEEFDMDFGYLSLNQVSNSIADNFGSLNNNSVETSSTGACANNSSPSPLSTPISNQFVNPFPSPGLNQTSFTFDDPTLVKQTSSASTGSNKTSKKSLSSTKSSKNDFSTTQDLNSTEKNQFAVLTSQTQIKIIALPINTCIHKQSISDGVVSKASVVIINSLSYLNCYLSNGYFLIYNLPNPTLKVNLNLNSTSYLHKEKDLLDRCLRTFTFSTKGHALFMCSPSEIQKIYLSTTNGASNLTDMLSEFFDPRIPSPAPPKPNLFKSLFSNTPFDREELFGENSGKPSTCIIKSVDGEVLRAKKELSELQKLALERGEKLSALELKSEQMTQAASAFAKNASDLANKYKNKKFF